MEARDEVRGKKFRVYRPNDAYIRIDWDEGAEAILLDAQEALGAFVALADGGQTPILVDMRGLRSIERAGRKAFADSPVPSRTALCVASAVSRAIANFFIGVSRPDVPTRVFTSLDDAHAWLLGHE